MMCSFHAPVLLCFLLYLKDAAEKFSLFTKFDILLKGLTAKLAIS